MKLWLIVAAVALLAASSCGSPIVGARCKQGFVLCQGECVDIDADFRNCGACGHVCGRFVCQAGMCTKIPRADAGLDAGPIDAGADSSIGSGFDAGSDAGSILVGQSDGGFNPDPGLTGCNLGEVLCFGKCKNPLTDHDNCGSCKHVCAGNEYCTSGLCAAICDPPFTYCPPRSCLDLRNDPDHCGNCNNECASGICESGVCADALPGHVIAIGHDFSAANNSMRRIAGNAIFLASGAPVQVIEYRGQSTSASVSGVEAAFDLVARETGRTWNKIDAADPAGVPLLLRGADVFVIHTQSGASKSTLVQLGNDWGNAMAQFVVRGGVIVLFDAPSPTNDGTYRVLEPAKIFSAASRSSLPGQQLRVQLPGIDVTARVPDRYMSMMNTVSWKGVTTGGTVMVVDKNMDPVVIHRVIVH